jgi:hypothetical protein
VRQECHPSPSHPPRTTQRNSLICVGVGLNYCPQNRAGSGSGKQWYGRLYEVVVEALRALATPQEHQKAVMTSPEVEPKMSGWLNVSTEADFNTLHDHGDALWSMVRACHRLLLWGDSDSRCPVLFDRVAGV